jgi:hypothetical protein
VVATYLLYAWPTVALSIVLGVALGWLTWGRSRGSTLQAHRDSVRRLAEAHDRELADRDSTVEILREELAAEASETARLRRLLGQPTQNSPAPPNEAPPSSSVLAAARAVANGHRGGADGGHEIPVADTAGRRARRRTARP